MDKKKRAGEYFLLLVLVLLGLAGGTARMRPEAAAVQSPTATPALSVVHTTPARETEAAPQESEPVETEPPVEITPEPEPERYTLHFIGDCTLASAPYFQGGKDGYDTVIGGDFSYPFAKTVQYFAEDDFTMANLECCLTESKNATQKTFTFRTSADYAKIMTEGSVEFVTLANNHVLDYGQQGYADTKAAVEAEGIAFAGRDEWTVYETERGLKIGVYAVSFGNLDQIRRGVKEVREAGADFVIAALHFGDEGSYQVNSDQKMQAHAAIDAGADFVYGSHAHTLQPVETYKDCLIYYCMGNWTFGGNTNPRDKDTFILRMILEQAADGTVKIVETEQIPCASSGETSRNNYQPVPYEEDSDGYKRVLSKLDGTFNGANLTIGYSYSNNE